MIAHLTANDIVRRYRPAVYWTGDAEAPASSGTSSAPARAIKARKSLFLLTVFVREGKFVAIKPIMGIHSGTMVLTTTKFSRDGGKYVAVAGAVAG